MSEKEILHKKAKREEAPTPPVNHRAQIAGLIDEQLEKEDVPTDWASKSFFIHLSCQDTGELVYCVLEGRRLTEQQYKMLFAIQMQIEISYREKHHIIPEWVASWFYAPDHVRSLHEHFAEEADITWDREQAGCFFAFSADAPDAGNVYSVVDWDF